MFRTSSIDGRSSKLLRDEAQPIGHVDDARTGPDVIAQVEYVAVRMRGVPCARPDDSDRDQTSAMDAEVRCEQHGRKVIERVAGEIADGAQLARAWGVGHTSRLDLIAHASGIFCIEARSRVAFPLPFERSAEQHLGIVADG